MGKLLDILVRNGRLLGWVMLAIMAALVVADILIPSSYDRFVWEQIGGFGAIYGLVASIIIIVVAKLLLHPLLNRSEDYYDHEQKGYQMNGESSDRKEPGNE